MQTILSEYNHEIPAVRANLYRILNFGKLAGTGKLIILPVDQGFEHGPDVSFIKNPCAYDPIYHLNLALDCGVNAYAAPIGMLEVAAAQKPGVIPMILKLNSSNSLKSMQQEPYQAVTSTVKDALKLGCVGVGFTIYPGSENCDEMLMQVQNIFQHAKELGLICIIWSYPRGQSISNDTALDIVSYAAHIGALTGAHIIKVKLPSEKLANEKLCDDYTKIGIDIHNLTHRVQHIKRCAFNNRRIVLFSGGQHKNEESLLNEIQAIKNGGGDGSIIGRNLFQREKSQAVSLVNKIIDLYLHS